jgi:hypothetical protein
MTKVRDLTRPIEGEEKKLKPIEFVMECPQTKWRDCDSSLEPQDWEKIELIAEDYHNNLDLMFAFDDSDRAGGILYLGHFNDGVVE